MSIANPDKEVTWAAGADPGDIAEPSDGQKSSGYTGTPAPVYQHVNWLLNHLNKWIEYLRERGIPDFDATNGAYTLGDICKWNGNCYISIQAGPHTVAPSNANYWRMWGGDTQDVASLITVGGNGITKGACRLSQIGTQKRLDIIVAGDGDHVDFTITLSGAADISRIFTYPYLSTSAMSDATYVTMTEVSHGWTGTAHGIGGQSATWVLTLQCIGE